MKNRVSLLIAIIILSICLSACNQPEATEHTAPKEEVKYSEGLEFKVARQLESAYLIGLGTCTDKNIVIPYTYEGFPVTEIQGEAFMNCESIESIVIPNTVSSIGAYAFAGCTSLKSVTLSTSTKYILMNAFSGCTSLKSITIPASIKHIYEKAFAGCTSLEAVILEDTANWGWGYWEYDPVYDISQFKTNPIQDDISNPQNVAKLLTSTHVNEIWCHKKADQ